MRLLDPQRFIYRVLHAQVGKQMLYNRSLKVRAKSSGQAARPGSYRPMHDMRLAQ